MKYKIVSPDGVRCIAPLLIILLSLFLAPQWLHAATGNIYMFTANPELERGTKGVAGFFRSLGYNVTLEECGDVSYENLDTDPDAAVTLDDGRPVGTRRRAPSRPVIRRIWLKIS